MIIRLEHISKGAVLNDIAKVFPNKGVSLVKPESPDHVIYKKL